MTGSGSLISRLLGFIPRRGVGLIGFIVLIALTFSLGYWLSGGNGTPSLQEAVSEGRDHAADEPTTWTCSMHPQIQLPTAGKCPICFMDLIPLESGGDESIDPNQLRLTPTAAKLAQIQTQPVRRAEAEAEVRLFGRLTYDERRLSYITAWAPGRLDKLHVDFTGATVKKGEPLVTMYSPELLATQEELIQASRAVSSTSDGGRLLTATARTTLEAAREKLRLYGLTDQQVAAIEKRDAAEDHLTIFSPASGIVIHKNALEGMYVTPGTRLFTIADLSTLWVIFDAYETDLPWLKVGQKVAFTTRSFPGEQFEAVITFIDPMLNTKTRTTGVRAEVDNSGGRLKPDMFTHGVVTAQLDAGGLVKATGGADNTEAPLLVPATAPLITGKRAVVYVELPHDDDRLFEGREVLLGPRAGDFYIVKDGLREGEMVVTNGAFKIDAELQIHAKPSMMSPEGGAPPPGHDHGGQGATPVSAARESKPVEVITISHQAVMTLTSTYDAYFRLQAALADDDLEAATKAADNVAAEINAVDMKLFEGNAHMLWMELSNDIAKHAVAAAAGMDIEEVRASFELVSNSIIELHNKFGHADERTFYLAFCPMAFGNKGAYWLQTDSIIDNPYFGASMLRCGEIRDETAAMKMGN